MAVENDRPKIDDDVIEPEEVIEINPEDQQKKRKNKTQIILIILAILYIISPIDILPEWLLGPLGLADDAAVLAYLLKTLYDRLRS